MTLAVFHSVRISSELVEHTEDALLRAGGEGFECFVLWSGRAGESGVFEVKTAHVPRQRALKTRDGLLVEVGGQELHRLNAWLLEHDEILIAQVHAHPADAYHSNTDDALPIITSEGGLSIVVPNFCERGLLQPQTVVYRLHRAGWREDNQVRIEVSSGLR